MAEPTLTDRIAALDDAAATRLLTTIAGAIQRRDEDAFATQPTNDLRAALGDVVLQEQAVVPATVSDGDLARAALLALAEDDELRPRIEAILQGPEAESFAAVSTILAVGAVLVALQIGWKYKSKDGRTTFEKKSLVGKSFVDFAGHLFGWLKTKP